MCWAMTRARPSVNRDGPVGVLVEVSVGPAHFMREVLVPARDQRLRVSAVYPGELTRHRLGLRLVVLYHGEWPVLCERMVKALPQPQRQSLNPLAAADGAPLG